MAHVIRSARESDIAELVDLWRLARPHDTVNPQSLADFFSSPGLYQPEAVLTAEKGADLAGFIIGTVREEREGRIPLFFVHPAWQDMQVADDLLRRVVSCFQKRGLPRAEAGTAWETDLSDCGYDTRYAGILAVFARNGFERAWPDEELDVDIVKDLRGLEIPGWASDARTALEGDGMRFALCGPEMRQDYLQFMLDRFSGYRGWCARAKRYVDCAEEPGFHLLALRGNGIVGFTECVFDGDWHIYATGVREDLRRRKIGSALVFLSLEEMKRRGAQRMYIGEAPLDFYHIVEGRILRRYMAMRKVL